MPCKGDQAPWSASSRSNGQRCRSRVLPRAASGDPTDGDTGDLWDSGDLSPGESFVQQFDEAGEFIYFCKHHPSVAAMRGAKVIVQP